MAIINALSPERFRRLAKEGFWIFFGQAMTVLGSLAGVRLLTELLDPSAYGELALGMTLATLLNQIMLGPLGNGITRFYGLALEQEDLRSYLSAVRRLLVSATVVTGLLTLLVLAGLLIAGALQWMAIAAAAMIFAILTGYNSILNGIQNAARQRSIVAVHQGMESWARSLVAAGLISWLGANSTVAVVGYVIASVPVLVSQYVCFRKVVLGNITAADNEKFWRERIWKYSWPFASWGVFSWAQQSSDRWALELFTTTREVGCYAALFQLGYFPILMAAGIGMQFFAPIFYQRIGDANDSRRNANVNILSWRLTGLALSATGVVFLLALLFHAQIFRIFVAAEYGSVSHLLPWVMLAGGLFAAGQTIALNLMSQIKTHAMVSAKIITALLGIALNLAGAYLYGTTGIVYASVVFSLSYFLWMLALSN